MKFRIILLFLFVTNFSLHSFSQVDDAKAREILDKVSAKVKTFKNMKFEFNYNMLDPKHKINNNLKGTIVMMGNKFNLLFMKRTIISDGKVVWTFDQDANEIQISNLDPKNDVLNPAKLLTSYDKSFKSKLIKTEVVNGKSVYIIDLTPSTAKAYYKIRLTIDKTEMRVISGTVYNKDNITYTYTVTKFTANVAVADNYFVMDTKKYKDAEVIDLR